VSFKRKIRELTVPYTAVRLGETRESWVGWAWLGDAGDLPLRVHLTRSGEEHEATLDSPAHRAFGMPVMVRQWDDSRMRIEAESRSGSLISIDGRLRGDLIEGAIQWAGDEGFSLIADWALERILGSDPPEEPPR
jgi:hypothetical protein